MLAMSKERVRSWEPGRGETPPSAVVYRASRPTSSAQPSRRTYLRRRVLAAIVLTVLVLTVWAALRVLGSATAFSAPERSPAVAPTAGQAHVVQPGETLWSIARRLDPGGDPRPVVDRLAAAHGGSQIVAGEVIVLPR